MLFSHAKSTVQYFLVVRCQLTWANIVGIFFQFRSMIAPICLNPTLDTYFHSFLISDLLASTYSIPHLNI
jgi:hypothetical protein